MVGINREMYILQQKYYDITIYHGNFVATFNFRQIHAVLNQLSKVDKNLMLSDVTAEHLLSWATCLGDPLVEACDAC